MSKLSSSSREEKDEDSCCESNDDESVQTRRKGQRSEFDTESRVTSEGFEEPAQIYSSTPVTPSACLHQQEKMRRRLQFFFMNPIEKWQAKRRFPYKFVVQVIKIVLVTMQLCLFAHSRYNHVNYTWDNKVTFSHLFLRGEYLMRVREIAFKAKFCSFYYYAGFKYQIISLTTNSGN